MMSGTGYGVQVVQRLLPDQWRILRELRLVALAEVLGDDHDDYLAEEALDEFAWRRMIATDPQFVASVHSETVGLISLRFEPDQEAEVTFLWVDPRHRRSSLAQTLTDVVADWADRAGVSVTRVPPSLRKRS